MMLRKGLFLFLLMCIAGQVAYGQPRHVVPDADHLIQFKLEGEGTIAGVDNGFQASLEPFKADYRKAYRGLCLAIVQAKQKTGKLKLSATSAGLKEASVFITVKK